MTIFNSIAHRFISNNKDPARVYRSRVGVFQGWLSVLMNGFLSLVKGAIGLSVGSISILADAIHTLSDVISSGIVIWGFKQAEKPADLEHPYGHGRAEYIATLIIAILLCVVGIEFIEASIKRLQDPIPVTPAWWMIAFIAATILLKEIMARFAMFLSKKIASGTLHADAWHHRTDAVSSFLVVVAMVSGRFGYPAVDGWAGLGVAFFIIWTGIEIARDAIDDLIGKPPTENEIEEIRDLVLNVDGVLGAHDITIHSYGRDKFASVHAEIDSEESPGRAHDIAEEVERVLQEILEAEPTVHIDPIQPGNPVVREVSSFLDSNWADDERISDIHDVRIVDTENHHVILFGLNVRRGMPKSEMVKMCQEIEGSLQAEFPGYDMDIKVSPIHRY